MGSLVSWVERASSALSGGREELCEAHGSAPHPLSLVDVVMPGVGPMQMYAYETDQWEGIECYCPGNDDVSRTLRLYGRWEAQQSAVISGLLIETPGLVVDVGSHLGWYSLMALALGHPVLAIDGSREHLDYLALSAMKMAARGTPLPLGGLELCRGWINGDTLPVPPDGCPDIALIKVDIEGNEREAINAFRQPILAGKVANITLEISPVFNDSYGALMDHLFETYDAHTMDDDPRHISRREAFEMLDTIPQFDLLFRLIR